MKSISEQQNSRFAFVWLAGIAITATGCTSIKLPSLAFAGGLTGNARQESRYESVDGQQLGLGTSVAEQTYHSVRRARSENAIVLQVADDDTPVRILPLPSGNKSVYVSNLLKETGVQKKLGFVEATLYRHSSDVIGGIPMEVTMSRDGQSVRPESDYALQPGDRLQVEKAANPALQGLVNTVLGL